jgi:DNA-binding transcriptional ArsR family regulator
LAVMLKAIAHPARIAILEQIIKANACICGDLADELGLAQPTISQHLKELKNAGLIQGTIEGVSVCYCIEPKAWKLLHENLNHFFLTFQDKGNCC